MNSKDYWAKREAEQLKHNITDEKEYEKQLQKIYSDMLASCQKEINAFYGKYAAAEGITLAEAKKKVSQLDIKEYERKAAKYVKDKDFSDKANEEMRLYNATMKINRLEMLKANIGLELIAGHQDLEKFMGGILKGRTEEELRRQAGILGKTIKNNAQLANAIVNGSFHNATFSDRIWLYQDLMKADLAKLLQSGMIQGKNARVLARELKNKFKVGTYNAERLMRTELARVQTEAQKQSFNRNGFSKYTFIVNGGCCDICKGLSGKHFEVAKMMPGTNAPPMHPHCRCSTAAYEDSAEYEGWLNYLEDGGNTAEWNQLTEEAKAKYKQRLTKSAKSDIIQPENVSAEAQEIVTALKNSGVEYNEVTMHSKALTYEEIIKAIAGGDNTSGSCASVGLAYVGQKCGVNVLDFRDGQSRNWFASKMNKIKMWDALGIKYITEDSAKSSLTNGKRILGKMAKGKEYYLSVGGHAAIVRAVDDFITDSATGEVLKIGTKYQYLELQSSRNNGWTDFSKDIGATLKWRFGCSTSSRYIGTAYLTDIDDVIGNEEFKTILGYINTAENKQRKGTNGTIK